MQHSNRMVGKLALAAALAVILAACSDSKDQASNPPTTTPPATTPQRGDTFGVGFGTSLRADPNTDARDPAGGDVNAVNPATDPVEPA